MEGTLVRSQWSLARQSSKGRHCLPLQPPPAKVTCSGNALWQSSTKTLESAKDEQEPYGFQTCSKHQGTTLFPSSTEAACLAYLPIVRRHQGQGDLQRKCTARRGGTQHLGAYSFRNLQSVTSKAGSRAAGRHGAGAAARSSHLDPQV